MTLAVKIRSREGRLGGFTLLEMMFTLSLIAILVGVSVVSYKPDSPAKQMQQATVKIEALSARGHTMALLHQKPFWLRFERNRVVLEGAEVEAVDTRSDEEQFASDDPRESEEEEQEISHAVEYDEFIFSEGMEVFVRRWGAAEMAWFHQEKEEDPVIFWNYESSGLCEPISIRFEIGENWTQLEMDPLTGRVSEETSEIYDR